MHARINRERNIDGKGMINLNAFLSAVCYITYTSMIMRYVNKRNCFDHGYTSDQCYTECEIRESYRKYSIFPKKYKAFNDEMFIHESNVTFGLVPNTSINEVCKLECANKDECIQNYFPYDHKLANFPVFEK